MQIGKSLATVPAVFRAKLMQEIEFKATLISGLKNLDQ